MANEQNKDFNAMLRDSKDMPKVQIITDAKSIEKYGGSRMAFAPPMEYDRAMKAVPWGKLLTVGQIREHFARVYRADFTDPITAGIFVSIVAWASAGRGSHAVLENPQGGRGAQPQVPRRCGSAKGKVGGRGAYRRPAG